MCISYTATFFDCVYVLPSVFWIILFCVVLCCYAALIPHLIVLAVFTHGCSDPWHHHVPVLVMFVLNNYLVCVREAVFTKEL